LEQNFTADAPNQKWVSDITYIWMDEGWLYLVVVLELYSWVIGWEIAEQMTATLVCDALVMAHYGIESCQQAWLSILTWAASIVQLPTRSFSASTH
jgi:transposase InsO family protein